MKSYREPTRDDWKKALVYVGAMVLFICTSAILLVYRFPPLGMIAWLVICVGGSLLLIVRWHASATAYRCPACAHEFEISALTDFLSPHVPSRKYLKCPNCGKRGWALVLMKH